MLLKDGINFYFNGNFLNYWSDKEFKPLISKYEDNKMEYESPYSKYSVCFSEVGFNYQAHPIIIIELEDDYVFLKAQTLYNENNLSFYLKNKIMHKEAFAIPKSEPIDVNNNKYYFKNDSIIDTSQLFIMKKKDFNECYDFNSSISNNTNYITDFNKEIIIQQVLRNIESSNYSLTRVIRTNGMNHSKLLYAPATKLKEIYDITKYQINNIPDLYKGIKQENLDYLDKYVNEYQTRVMKNDKDTLNDIKLVNNVLTYKFNKWLEIRDDFFQKYFPEDFIMYRTNEIDRNKLRLYLFQENITPPKILNIEKNIYYDLSINDEKISKLINEKEYNTCFYLKELAHKFNVKNSKENELEI